MPVLMRHFSRCIPKYDPSNEEVAPYHTTDWTPVSNISRFESVFHLSDICPRPWRYQEPRTLNTLSYSGLYSSYSGGGFVADLGYDEKSARDVIKTLKGKHWIDNRTSAVFVEFTVFEPASLLISAVKLLYERLPTGGVRCTSKVEALTVYAASDPGFRSLYQTCQLMLIGVILFLFACECFKVYKMGCPYFFRFWSWMDLVLMICSLCAMGTFFFKEKYASDFIRGVHENPFKTSSTDFIVLWSHMEVYLLSFVIFIVTIKLLRLMRFNNHIGHLMETLRASTDTLASFYVVLFVVLVGFTQVGMLLFGRNLESYSTFLGSMSVVLQKLLGTSMQLKEVQRVNKVLGSVFVFAYSLTVALILLNVFISILNTSYKEVREYGHKRAVSIAIRQYVRDYFKSCYRELRQECIDFSTRLKKAKGRTRRLSLSSRKYSKTNDVLLCNYHEYQRVSLEENRKLLTGASDSSISGNIKRQSSGKKKVSFDTEPIKQSVYLDHYFVSPFQIEIEPCFIEIEDELIDFSQTYAPLASFDEEDDIGSFVDELYCLEDIKASLIEIECDLLRATDNEYIPVVSDDEDDDAGNVYVSKESIESVSSLSVCLSMFETEQQEQRQEEEKDAEEEFSEIYSDEEEGVSDEDDEDDLLTFHSRSPFEGSMNSMNEICYHADQIPVASLEPSYDTSMLAPPPSQW